jgi:hypothetical protein
MNGLLTRSAVPLPAQRLEKSVPLHIRAAQEHSRGPRTLVAGLEQQPFSSARLNIGEGLSVRIGGHVQSAGAPDFLHCKCAGPGCLVMYRRPHPRAELNARDSLMHCAHLCQGVGPVALRLVHTMKNAHACRQKEAETRQANCEVVTAPFEAERLISSGCNMHEHKGASMVQAGRHSLQPSCASSTAIGST